MKTIVIMGLLGFFLTSCFSERKASQVKTDLRNPYGLYEKEELLLPQDSIFEKAKEAYKKILVFAFQKRGSMRMLTEDYVVFHAASHADNPNLLVLHIRKGIFPQSVNIEFQVDSQGEDELLFKWETSNIAALAVTRERVVDQIIKAGNLSPIKLLNQKTDLKGRFFLF